MRSVLVSVKYRYCWVASGRELVNGFGTEGLSVAAVSVSSDTAGAGLFLEVIVRHVPGLVGSVARCHQAITNKELATLQRDIVPSDRALPERR